MMALAVLSGVASGALGFAIVYVVAVAFGWLLRRRI